MAIPKYREAKQIIEKVLEDYFRNVSRKEMAPFDESPSITQHEGKTLKHNSLDDASSQKTLTYQEAVIEYELKYEDVPNMSEVNVFAILEEKAKELGVKMAKYHFKVLGEMVKETGNTINANNKEPSTELYLEALKSISISFDKDGKPSMPTLIIRQSDSYKWKAVMEEMNTPEFKAKEVEVIEQKKKEYDAEQASRKLVD